ncbi:hypothetical protein ACEZDB_36700 [Streptacidiphilus sp. N1-3]|uniref:Uncharacterized protein n=1 Tax=Streptacidiphilus alkalitolerans TaxID=3342712 RepID=A0ABV6XDB5_9ACTN
MAPRQQVHRQHVGAAAEHPSRQLGQDDLAGRVGAVRGVGGDGGDGVDADTQVVHHRFQALDGWKRGVYPA